MSETALTDSQADALSGTTDPGADMVYPAIGESTYYTTWYRWAQRLLTLAKMPGNALRVHKDGDLTFGVRPGKVAHGAGALSYAGSADNALTDDATNYVYLTLVSGALSLGVSTSGFPAAATTPFIPLATIVTSSGDYAHTDITDCRDRALFGWATGLAPDDANTLAGGANADALHLHAADGLADAVQDLLPNLNITAGAESADKRTVTLQARDAADNDLAERFRIRVWIATSDFGAPSAAGNTVAVETGTQLRQITADADYEIISDATGKAEIGVTISGAASRYVMAEIDGRVHSSGEVTWAA